MRTIAGDSVALRAESSSCDGAVADYASRDSLTGCDAYRCTTPFSDNLPTIRLLIVSIGEWATTATQLPYRRAFASWATRTISRNVTDASESLAHVALWYDPLS